MSVAPNRRRNTIPEARERRFARARADPPFERDLGTRLRFSKPLQVTGKTRRFPEGGVQTRKRRDDGTHFSESRPIFGRREAATLRLDIF